MASKYIKSKSNYVYRSQHQKTSGGTVFERDFMTVSSFDAMSPSERQVYGINNFKFQVRSGLNEQKKHNNGRWIPDYEVGDEQNITPKKTGTRLNPDYESMKDFAYYGSAVNLVKASVVEVLLNFPAELYFTDKEFYEKVTGGTESAYYLVSNDYGIDVITEDVDEETVENELRYLAKSINKYVIFEPITNTSNSFAAYESCPSEITIHHYNRSCEEISNGTIIADAVITITENGNVAETLTIYAYQLGDDITLLHSDITKVGYRIRPNQTCIDEFFDNASDFVRVLLNRDTNPLYMATFNTPYETEKGVFTYKRNYIWPTTYGWNPDISNAAYENYLESLIYGDTFITNGFKVKHSFMLYILMVFWSHSIFTLGSTMFRKHSFIKTILSLFGAFLLLVMLIGCFASSAAYSNRDITINFLVDPELMFSITAHVIVIGTTAVAYYWAYRRFCNKTIL